MPHLLFARGSMVELLIKSNISRYTEFKAVTRVLTVLKGVLEHVPSSRLKFGFVISVSKQGTLVKSVMMSSYLFIYDFSGSFLSLKMTIFSFFKSSLGEILNQ